MGKRKHQHSGPQRPDHQFTGPGTATDPGPIGGQALVEGVMMRRGDCWGAAVRRADGTIATTSRSLPPQLDRWRSIPLIRGAVSLSESVGLGTRATTWASRERVPEEEGGVTKLGVALSVVAAVLLAVGLFALLPAWVAHRVGPGGSFGFNLTEGALRLGVLLGYLLALSRSAQIRRVFAYHGAEHMTIHAFEHGVPLRPDAIAHFDRRHPRCGTSFLIVVVIMTVVVHLFLGRPSFGLVVISRLALLPVVAALAYELIRFAGRHQRAWYGRALMAPGFVVQAITTRPASDDQIEVAVVALEATLAAPAATQTVPAAVAAGVAR